ncbi:hypothetical protein [Xenorhabdus taiwanensis]|uniref:Secreted protein n=1 Tax=Xenorhabdus taiwanensis TaxID=3085177 RepID=A0ABN7C2X7_9GAMM|nr:hypothetical protein TCT1_16070 [Xenorhabdus sp. TCT-1]
MNYFKEYTAYTLLLTMILFANNALSKESTVQIDKKVETTKTKGPSNFASYYNMHVKNNSVIAQVEMTRTGYDCMYGAGPEKIDLDPQGKADFDLETNNGFFQGCTNVDKVVRWSVKYMVPNSEDRYCNIKLVTTVDDFVSQNWSTTFTHADSNCNVPLKFICNGSESACQTGDTSSKNQITLEIVD